MDNPLVEVYKDVLDTLFTKYASKGLVDCHAHRAIICEFSEKPEDVEPVLIELVERGAILLQRTEVMEAQAEEARRAGERKQKAADRDYVRKLNNPAFTREEHLAEIGRLRKQEEAAKEKSPLLQKSVDELRAIVKQEQESKNRRPGIEPLPVKIRLRYRPDVEVVLDARGIKSLDSDELRYLGQRFGWPELNARIAATSGGE